MVGGIDETEAATLLPPIQYAKLRGIYPQKVYTALRNKRLDYAICQCGRKCVSVEEADKYFKLGEYRVEQERDSSDERADEADGGELHNGPSEGA